VKNPIRIRIAIATGNTTQSAQNIVIAKTMSAVMISALMFLFIVMLFDSVQIYAPRAKKRNRSSERPPDDRIYGLYLERLVSQVVIYARQHVHLRI
jgi:hypothetical protein